MMLGIIDYSYPPIRETSSHPPPGYFFVFGMISVVPLFGSSCGYLSIELRSQWFLLISMLANFLFLLAGILYLFVYLLAIKPPTFTKEHFFLTSVGVILVQSAMLCVVHCSLLKQMGLIRVVKRREPETPEVEDSDSSDTDETEGTKITGEGRDKNKSNDKDTK